MTLYSAQQARRSLFHTIRFRAVSQVATVLSYVVLVRGMQEHAFGIYNLFYSFIPVITTLASFGLDSLPPRLLRVLLLVVRSVRIRASYLPASATSARILARQTSMPGNRDGGFTSCREYMDS